MFEYCFACLPSLRLGLGLGALFSDWKEGGDSEGLAGLATGWLDSGEAPSAVLSSLLLLAEPVRLVPLTHRHEVLYL
jgi:hypothetical protein